MGKVGLFAAVVGVALFVALLVFADVGGALAAIRAAGWSLVIVVAFRFVPYALEALGWRVLLEPPRPFGRLVLARWVAESFNTLLPMAQVGGHVLRAHMIRAGRPASMAGASVVVDFTIGLGTQIVFGALGALLLLPTAQTEAARVLGGVLVFAMLVAGFLAAQRKGLFGLALRIAKKLAGSDRLAGLSGHVAEMEARIRELYASRGRLARCAAWRLAGWVVRAGEVYLALSFMGYPATLWDALVLESLSTIAQSTAFLAPGGIGVRDGSLVLLGGWLGLPMEAGLAVALVKRAREIVMGVPCIIGWALAHGGLGRLLKHRPGSKET